MPVDNSTALVSTTCSAGTGWTVNVTAANLNSDLTDKDFIVKINGVVNSNVNWTKTSTTLLTYGGSVTAGTEALSIQRSTSIERFQEQIYKNPISSTAWEGEFNTVHRKLHEFNTFGSTGTGNVVSDEVYGATWNGDTTLAPSRNAVYDKLNNILTGTETFTGTKTFSNTVNFDGAVDFDSTTVDLTGSTTVTTVTPSSNDDSQKVVNISWINDFMPQRIVEGRFRPNGALNSTVNMGYDASGTLIYKPYGGNKIGLYDGAVWKLYDIPDAGITLTLSTLTAATNYDLFVYDNAGTLTLDAASWSSDTARGSSRVTTQNGVPVKDGAVSRRYVGCFRNNASQQMVVSLFDAGSTSPQVVNNCHNYYNQIPIRQVISMSGNSGNLTGGGVETSLFSGIVLIRDDRSTAALVDYQPQTDLIEFADNSLINVSALGASTTSITNPRIYLDSTSSIISASALVHTIQSDGSSVLTQDSIYFTKSHYSASIGNRAYLIGYNHTVSAGSITLQMRRAVSISYMW